MPRVALDDKYAYRVIWSEEDGEYVGLCAEFPSLSWLAPSRSKALDGIIKLVQATIAEMVACGEKPPVLLKTRCRSTAWWPPS